MRMRPGHREASYIGGVDAVPTALHPLKLEDPLLRHRDPLLGCCTPHLCIFYRHAKIVE